MTATEIKNAIEAVLFASGNSVSVSRFAQALDITEKQVKKYADELMQEYTNACRGITIVKLDDSYQMVSQKLYAPYIRTIMDLRRNVPLSQAAMEVLAVIAYNQPVTKAFIEQVRGVDCSGVIGSLTTKDLIEEKGRLELPGRPLLYGTTENFLRCFSISSIEELPALPDKDVQSNEGNDNDNSAENENLEQDQISDEQLTFDSINENNIKNGNNQENNVKTNQQENEQA